MSHSHGFPPASHPDARILILGSMPGLPSLRAQRYYAHPRNAFWPILMQTLGISATVDDPLPDYEERLHHLRQAGIALWDVLQYCERSGSLDAKIRRDSMVLNNFPAFMETHPQIRCICFNGATAAALFERHAAPALRADGLLPPHRLCLPSTSPAHASVSREEKLQLWRTAIMAPPSDAPTAAP